MFLPADARTHDALNGSHTIQVKVEVWRGGEQIGEVAGEQILAGSVTDKWVSGVRRTLEMQVEPTSDWRQWLQIGVELRPFRGVWFAPHEIEMCPLGVFPVRAFDRPFGARSEIPVRAQDRWSRVVADTFGSPIRAYQETVARTIALLVEEVDPYSISVSIETASEMRTPPGVWEKGRSETILDLADVIGVDVFMDRNGSPVIRDRPQRGNPVWTLRTGTSGVILDGGETVDWTNVVNSVGVFSTAADSTLEPVWLGISDPESPAYRGVIAGGGTGGWQATRVSSSAFTTREEMIAAGQAALVKGERPARQRTLTAVPHPGLDAADTVLVETAPGEALELVQIDQVTHPLTAGDAQSITTVTTGAAA